MNYYTIKVLFSKISHHLPFYPFRPLFSIKIYVINGIVLYYHYDPKVKL